MKQTIIIILATLHQFHLKCKFYALDDLRKIIEKIDPNVICVELTENDLKEKKEQNIKIEYPKCIIPLADEKDYKLIAMEPNETEYSRIINTYRQGIKKIETEEPKKIELLNKYTKVLYDYLWSCWHSPIDVNSSLTNVLFDAKHTFQNSLFGSGEEQSWEEWNDHFLNTILNIVETHRGKKILVTVGVEHVYWLMNHLKDRPGIKLVEVYEVYHEQ